MKLTLTAPFEVLARRDRIDAFAAAALTGMLASGDTDTTENPDRAAAWSYDFANAMEAERDSRRPPRSVEAAR